METIQTANRMHPLMVGATASVMLLSLVGTAAITGILPTSRGSSTPAEAPLSPLAVQSPAATAVAAPVQLTAAPVPLVVAQAATQHRSVVRHPAVVRHHQTNFVAQPDPERSYAQAPAYQPAAPVAQNSPLGIGIGAVVGGLIGHQVGGGNGNKLATIAGALGGGFLGNEIAKRH